MLELAEVEAHPMTGVALAVASRGCRCWINQLDCRCKGRLQQAQCVEIDADDEEEGEGAGPQDERGLEAALSQLRVE